jgi:hypothetical protein
MKILDLLSSVFFRRFVSAFYDHPSGATRIRTSLQWKSQNLDALETKP